MRESPALRSSQALLDGGATVRAFDPEAMAGAQAALPRPSIYCRATPTTAAEGADVLVMLTEWDEFR